MHVCVSIEAEHCRRIDETVVVNTKTRTNEHGIGQQPYHTSVPVTERMNVREAVMCHGYTQQIGRGMQVSIDERYQLIDARLQLDT